MEHEIKSCKAIPKFLPETKICTKYLKLSENKKICISYERVKSVVFKCENGVTVYPNEPISESIIPSHSYLVKYVLTSGLDSKPRASLVSYQPIHDYVVDSVTISKVLSNSKLKVSVLARLRCKTCGTTQFIDHQYLLDGSVVLIDKQPYFIPSDESVLSPIPLPQDTSSSPKVEYITTKSGILVPITYLSEESLKRINELDDQYVEANKELNVETSTSFSQHKFKLEKKYNALKEQVEIVLDELRKKGFEIEIDPFEIEITIRSRDNSVSFFRQKRYEASNGIYIIKEYKGELSPLGDTIAKLIYIEKGFLGTTIDKLRLYNENICFGKPGSDAIKCENTTVLISDAPRMHLHEIAVKFKNIYSDEFSSFALAYSYSILHPLHSSIKNKFKALVENRVTEIGERTLSCEDVMYSRPLKFELEERSVAVVNGEPYAFHKSETSIYLIKSNIGFSDVVDTEVSSFFLKLRDVYIPLDYISIETLDKILMTFALETKGAKRKILDIVINELVQKGFKFEVKGVCREDFRITVTSPDGKRGIFEHSRWDTQDYYCCELAPLAITYCKYLIMKEKTKKK